MAPRLSGRRDKFDLGQQFSINITPLVGVMLLLLLVFMVTGSAPTASIKLDNPPGDWFGPPPPGPQQVFINVEPGHKLYIRAKPTSLKTLVTDVGAAVGGPHPTDEFLFVRAGRDVPYGDFMTVMSTLKHAGYNVGVIMEDL